GFGLDALHQHAGAARDLRHFQAGSRLRERAQRRLDGGGIVGGVHDGVLRADRAGRAEHAGGQRQRNEMLLHRSSSVNDKTRPGRRDRGPYFPENNSTLNTFTASSTGTRIIPTSVAP